MDTLQRLRSSLTAVFHVFECISPLFLELQRKEKVEENNASVPSNMPKVQTSSRNESKHDLGKVISREQLVNREVQGDTNDSKCRKTETEQAAQGNNSLDLETSEQEKGSRNEVLGKDISTQKKRKRCWTCKAKLELAQRELGNCRCGNYLYVVYMYDVIASLLKRTLVLLFIRNHEIIVDTIIFLQ